MYICSYNNQVKIQSVHTQYYKITLVYQFGTDKENKGMILVSNVSSVSCDLNDIESEIYFEKHICDVIDLEDEILILIVLRLMQENTKYTYAVLDGDCDTVK